MLQQKIHFDCDSIDFKSLKHIVYKSYVKHFPSINKDSVVYELQWKTQIKY
jgi:hypothetical protein